MFGQYLQGIDIYLKDVHAVGVYGWNTIFETVIGEWLEDISRNQVNLIINLLFSKNLFIS